jgi:glycerol-3-phosphate dehydrogenase
MPITFAVNEMVHHGADPKTAVSLLMTREYKAE